MKYLIEITFLSVIKLILEYVFQYYITDVFAYELYTFNYNHNKYIVGWIVFIVIHLILYLKRKHPLNILFLILFIIYLIPNIILYGYSNKNTTFFIAISVSFIIIFLFTKKSFNTTFKFKDGVPIILIISLLLTIVVILNLFITTKGHYVLKFDDVYAHRLKYSSSFAGIFGYLNGWVARVFAVFLFAWNVYKKNRLNTFLFMFVIASIYAFSGHKSILTSIVMVILFYNIYKFNNYQRIILISAFLVLISLISYSAMGGNIKIGSLLLRRTFFVPANLNYVYYDFFSKNEYIYWSNSILKRFIHYPYPLTATHMIGKYLGHPEMGANTGLIGSAFMHAGYLGVIIYTIFSVIVLNLVIFLSKNINLFLLTAILYTPITTMFINSDFFTTMLTHGFIILIFILFFIDEKNKNKT